MVKRTIHTAIVNFDNIDLRQAGDEIRHLAYSDAYAYVVTPNMDHLSRLCTITDHGSQARYHGDLRQIYQQASLTLCDSRIIALILRFVGKSVKAVIPGSDLTKYLFDCILCADARVLIVGCPHEQFLALQHRYPQLDLHHINPTMGFIDRPDEVTALVAQVKACGAHYIFLAVGSPRQEVVAHKLQAAEIDKGVALCIGASINFLTGTETRAPRWVQVIGMEWCYRMLQDPKRLVRRYAANALHLPTIIQQLKRP